MSEEKKSISEETKELQITPDNVVDFDGIREEHNANKNSETEKNKASDKTDYSKKEIANHTEKVSEKEKESKSKEKEQITDSDNKKVASEHKETDEEKAKEAPDNDAKKSVNNNAISQSKKIADAKAAQASVKEEKPEIEKKKSGNEKKAVKIVFSSIVAIIAIAYIAGCVYFSNYFYPDVAINGTDVSNMNIKTAKQTLDNFYKDYVLTLETIEGKQVTIKGTDISMQISLHDEFYDCLKKQQAYAWFINMFKHHDYTIAAEATWDQDALSTCYQELKMLDKKYMTAPKDAYIGIDNGKFAIIKEELGNTILVEAFRETVEESLTGVIPTVNLQEAGCYKLPDVYETDETLKKEFDEKSEYATAVIKLQLDDLTLEPGMDLYDAVLEKNGESYKVSKSAVEAYVKDLAAKYDTFGKNRSFTTSFSNRKVEVTGTAFGYEMDQTATTNALYNALTAKKATTVEVVFTQKGYTLQGENDIGDTYIEVNLSEQKVVAYKDGKKIAEGDCVSGNESTGNGTCLGMYKIQDKLSPTVLRGQKKPVTKTVTKKNKKGKKVKVQETTYEYEYESPVTFWMQFNGGFGLHDAAGWRSTYGGSIYYYSGSHGCVNLPYDFAKQLYDNFEIGDPVIVYFWDNENRK